MVVVVGRAALLEQATRLIPAAAVGAATGVTSPGAAVAAPVVWVRALSRVALVVPAAVLSAIRRGPVAVAVVLQVIRRGQCRLGQAVRARMPLALVQVPVAAVAVVARCILAADLGRAPVAVVPVSAAAVAAALRSRVRARRVLLAQAEPRGVVVARLLVLAREALHSQQPRLQERAVVVAEILAPTAGPAVALQTAEVVVAAAAAARPAAASAVWRGLLARMLATLAAVAVVAARKGKLAAWADKPATITGVAAVTVQVQRVSPAARRQVTQPKMAQYLSGINAHV